MSKSQQKETATKALETAIETAFESGVSVDQVMSSVSRVVGRSLDFPEMTTNTLLSLYRVWPRINEELELMLARSECIRYGLCSTERLPSTLTDLKVSQRALTEKFRYSLATVGMEHKSAKRRAAAMYESLEQSLQGVYKLWPDVDGVDLVTIAFCTTKDQKRKLWILVHQVKDYSHLYPCHVIAARDKMLDWIDSFRASIAEYIDPQVKYSHIDSVIWQARITTLGPISKLTQKKIFDPATERGIELRVHHGEDAIKRLFVDDQHRQVFLQQVRRQ